MLIYLFVDAARRDTSNNVLLQMILENMGHQVFLVNRRNKSFFTELFPPDILVTCTPSIYIKEDEERQGGGPRKTARRLLKKALRTINFSFAKETRYCTMESEGFVDNENLELYYPPEVDYSRYSRLFLWSEINRKWLMENRGVCPEAAVAVGSSRLDLTNFFKRNHDGVKKDGKTIGFVGRFPAINPFDQRGVVRHLMRPTALRSDLTALDDTASIKMEIDSLMTYHRLFEFLYKNTDYYISYRPHPNERTASYLSLIDRFKGRFFISGEQDYHEWVAGLDVMISPISTTAIDAYILGVPIINIDSVTKAVVFGIADRTSGKAFIEYSYNPETLEEVHKLLLREKLEPKSSELIAQAIEKYYNGNLGDYHTLIIARSLDALGDKRYQRHNRLLNKLLIKILKTIDLLWIMSPLAIKDRECEKIYNYNFLTHRTSDFVKILGKEIIESMKNRKE